MREAEPSNEPSEAATLLKPKIASESLPSSSSSSSQSLVSQALAYASAPNNVVFLGAGTALASAGGCAIYASPTFDPNVSTAFTGTGDISDAAAVAAPPLLSAHIATNSKSSTQGRSGASSPLWRQPRSFASFSLALPLIVTDHIMRC